MKKLMMLGAMLSIAGFAAPPGAAAQTLKGGVWQYKTSSHWSKGRCPAPRPGKGRVKIKRKGKRFTLLVQTGMTCKPASMCLFKGARKGKLWIASNSATVDGEGGTAKNVLKLVVRTAKKLTGSVISEYKHPSGFTCRWGFKFVATR